MECCKEKDAYHEGRVRQAHGRRAFKTVRASKAQRRMAIMSDVARDRPDLAVTARESDQRMAGATEGSEFCRKRAIRYSASHPCGVLK